MAGWLNRATESFRKQPPAPEPYEVSCDCGGRVMGVRLPVAQRPPCPSCGRFVFVLPVNVYPRTTKPASKKGVSKNIAPNSSARKDRESSASGTETNSPRKGKLKSAPETSTAPAQPSGIALEAREKLLTPFRLTVLAMLAICGLTGWGLWYRQRVENAKTIVAKATESGLRALSEGDYELAARDLERAREAVDLLKRTDNEAQTVRRLCREAVAARGLAHEALFDILKDALADIKPGERDAKRFNSLHRGAWVLFDVTVLIPADTAQPCVIDMPLLRGVMPLRMEANFAGLRRAARQTPAGEPVRVIFAAQLEKLTPALAGESEAVLTLNDQSAFLWTSYENFAALGYHEDDAEAQQATRTLLEQQLELMKETP